MPKSKKRESKPKEQKKEPDLAKRLDKALAKEKYITAGPMITTPEIFAHIQGLTKQYLAHNHYSEASRQFVAGMAFKFRQESMKRFNHDTVETFHLANILRQEIQGTPRVPRKDALTHIMQTYPQSLKLDVYQQSAAEKIQAVWHHFGKASGLLGSGRNLLRSNGSGKVIHAVETMSQDQWAHYRKVYTPWCEIARTVTVGNSQVTIAAIVFKILVEDLYPEELDKAFGLKRGKAYRAFRLGLSMYLSPEGMREALSSAKAKPSSKVDAPSQRETSPVNVISPPGHPAIAAKG